MDFEAKIIEIIAEHLAVPKDQFKRNTSFTEDLEADSVEIIELALEFEQVFGVSIEDQEMYKIKTVQDAINLVQKKLTEIDK